MPGNKHRVYQKGCSFPSYLHNSKTNITHSSFFLSFFVFSFKCIVFGTFTSLECWIIPLAEQFLAATTTFFRWRQTTVCVITATNEASFLNHNVAWYRISSWTAVNSISMFNSLHSWLNKSWGISSHLPHWGWYIFYLWNCILWLKVSYKNRD